MPPYDHRNMGKSEIMHYLGGYDAREGTAEGYQTVHNMGVAHGND
jgi:homogentisate 1,2-dioxygenase